MPKRNLPVLIGFIILCEFVGAIGFMIASPSLSTWYLFLRKPPFMPSVPVMGLVWAILYLLMGISAYLIYKQHAGYRTIVNNAMYMFILQLIISLILWAAFFDLMSIAGGFAVTTVLWIALFFTIMEFYRIDSKAAWLLVPYILWVTFLTLAAYSLLTLN